MSRLDATAATYVDGNQYIRPVNFIFMDFVGDILRANDSGINLTVAGQTDADLNGTYDGVTADFASMSPVKVGAGGSDTVSVRLSGIKTLDDTTLDTIGDETKWKGRVCKIWRLVWNQSNVGQGAYEHYYTGYMVDLLIAGTPNDQFIEISIENYLAAYTAPSMRTYLSQRDFDPGDASGEATQSIANGGADGHSGAMPTSGSSGTGSVGVGSGMGGSIGIGVAQV